MYMAKAKSVETLEIHEEPVLSVGSYTYRLIGFRWVSEQVYIDHLMFHLKVAI